MRYLSILIMASLCSNLWAQEAFVNGKIQDKDTGEPLIGATIIYTEGKGALSDFNGEFYMSIPYGDYTFTISYTGFESKTITKSVNKKDVYIDIKLSPVSLREVTVIADVAKTRETPVAFSNISVAKLEEELASQIYQW